MPLGSKDNPKDTSSSKSSDAPTADEAAALAANPHASQDPNIPDGPEAELDPTKVVGTYAMQPDPNDERPAPLPNIHPGVHEAPADDEPGTPAINRDGE
jgi:hypothetical protein